MTEQELFLDALELPEKGERRAFLQKNCGGDSALLDRVSRLLEAEETMDGFLEGTVDKDFPSLVTSGVAGTDVTRTVQASRFDFLESSDVPNTLGRIGDYLVEGLIGAGGMGLVFRARDTTLHRPVAIKALSSNVASDAGRQRFVREARAAAAVVHRNVVTIHAVHEGKVPFIVMELVEGETLGARIRREGHLRPSEVVSLSLAIASGLAAAHAQGLVHRDIKPENILLKGDEAEVKITDFGLARVAGADAITMSGFIAGTPAFMSPEQGQGLSLDHRSDLFSLGSLMYTMCTGQSPFRGDSPLAVIRLIVDTAHQPIPFWQPETPEGLCKIIDRLLAKSPDDRFQTATDVLHALKSLRERQGETTQPAVLVQRQLAEVSESNVNSPLYSHLPKTSRDKRIRWMIGGVLIAAAVLAGILLKITRPDGTVVNVDFPAGSTIEMLNETGEPAENKVTATQPMLPTKLPGTDEPSSVVPPNLDPNPNVLALLGQSDTWTWSEPEPLGNGINADNNDSQPHLTPDGLELWFHSSRQDFSPGHKILMSRRASVTEPFPAPTLVATPINLDTGDYRDASSPRLTADGLDAVFVSIREGTVGHMDVWMAHRDSIDAPFQAPVNLGEPINSRSMELSPAISGDGLTLIYSAYGRTKSGGTDLYEARRTSRSEPFGPPVNLGPPINSPEREAGAWMSLDGLTLVYRSYRDAGSPELFVTTRATLDTPFHAPVKLAAPFNCGLDGVHEDGFAASADWSTVVFASNRPGGAGMQDLWITRRVPKSGRSTIPNSGDSPAE